MPRPKHRRRICGKPHSHFFKPAGVSRVELEEVTLNQDEFEAIRLKDFKGLDQETAAKEMNISQPTFHRVLVSGRGKVAEAIVKGKSIKIPKNS